jgi:heme/copper-type cytochrome/quinol oxidase subunit 2
MIIRSADITIQIPEDTVKPSEGKEDKSVSSGIVVLLIVAPLVAVIIVFVVMIMCILKKNRKSPYEGMTTLFSFACLFIIPIFMF